jgi:hypothetical protein
MTVEEQKKAEELKKAEEAKKAEELKKAEEAKIAEEAKKAEESKITEEKLLKAIDKLVEFSKARKDIEEEEEDEEEEEELEESFSGNFGANDTLEKAIEVSPFLEALVGETSTSIKAVGKEVSSLKKSQTEFVDKHIDILKGFSDTIKGLTTKIEEMSKSFDERLKRIEETPVALKKSITKVGVLEKSFSTGVGGDDFTAIPKRKIADALGKAVDAGKINGNVLFAFEAEHNYPLSDEQKEIVKAFL